MKIAIVIPRYGEQIVGGAETLAKTFAEYLAQQNWQVTILTTCAQNYHTWENHFPKGKTSVNQVEVIRFPIADWDADQHNQLNYRLSKYAYLPLVDQNQWLANGAHSPELYTYIDASKEIYDVIFALPYLSVIVQYAAWVAPEKFVIIPCLHDEAHAYMEPLHLLLEAIRGVLFLTPEERSFAYHTLNLNLQNTAVLGMGLNDPPQNLPSIAKPKIPYILIISRLEGGKNLALLYEYTQRYVDEGGSLKLQIIGVGDFTPPDHPAFNLCGYVSHAEKLAWAQSALAVCQPSLMESFSIVIMESWQMGRPVLVHKECAITTGHVQRSSGGFSFANYHEFAYAINWLKSNPNEASQMGNRGKQYVEKQYRWPNIFQKLNSFLSS